MNRRIVETDGSEGGKGKAQSNSKPTKSELNPTRRYREGIVNDLCKLGAGSIVLVATELGMGRREVLMALSKQYRDLGYFVQYAYCDPCDDAANAASSLEAMIERCLEAECSAVAIIDNYPVSNSVYSDSLDEIVHVAADAGVSVFVGSLPEGEVLFEEADDVVSFWSSDLLIASEDSVAGKGSRRYTNGIPALEFECAKAYSAHMLNPINSPSFATTYSSLVAHTQRLSLTREERIACACMLLLGSGTLDELREVAGNVDTETFVRFARDEPILGVSSIDMTFDCVGSSDSDAAKVCITAFADDVGKWWEVLPNIVELLMRRDNPTRAARVCAGIPDRVARCKLALRYFFPLVNAGMIDIVLESCSMVFDEHYRGITGAEECRCVLSSLFFFEPYEGVAMLDRLSTNTVRGRHAELCVACREQLRGKTARTLLRDRPEDDELSRALVMHGRVLSRIVDGEVAEARLLAMEADVSAGSPTVLSLLLSADDKFCATLCGDLICDGEDKAISQLLVFLEDALPKHQRYRYFIEVVKMLFRVAHVLVGETDDAADFDRAYHRAVKQEDAVLCGAFLLGAAMAELHHRHWEGSDARLGLAINCFMKAGADFYAHACHLLRYVLHVSQGGQARVGELERCMGDSVEGDLLVVIVEGAALGRQRRDLKEIGLEEALLEPPKNVLWILLSILTCFGSFSARVFNALPAFWASVCGRYLELRGVEVGAWTLVEQAHSPFAKTANAIAVTGVGNAACPVRIRMLGGFDVWVDGMPNVAKQLEQRKAKMLLALLASKQGHWLNYMECRDNIWPRQFDLVKLKKNVSMALGVLRSALRVDKNLYGVDTAVTITHVGEFRIKLEERLVSCDVDQFEYAAKQIIGSRMNADEIVALGRVVEDLYVGDLYEFPDGVPDTMNSRNVELQFLYVDAMQVAASAAAKTRQLTCACRFARNAYVKSGMRQDLLQSLMKLLIEAGRKDEAEYIYDTYVSYAIENGIELSKELRELATKHFGEDGQRSAVRFYSEARLKSVELMDEKTWRKRRGSKCGGGGDYSRLQGF